MHTRTESSTEQEWRRRLLASLPLRYRSHHAMYTWGQEDWGETSTVEVRSETPRKNVEEPQCTCIPHTRREVNTQADEGSYQVAREDGGYLMAREDMLRSKKSLSSSRLDRVATGHHLPRIAAWHGLRRHASDRIHTHGEQWNMGAHQDRIHMGLRWNSQQNLNLSCMKIAEIPEVHGSDLFRSLSDPEISRSSYKATRSDISSGEYETQEAIFESFDTSSCESFSFREKHSATENTCDVSLSPSEELISLCHIQESMVKHCYTATRGQRERELEWLELVPSRLLVRNSKRIIKIFD